MQSTIRIDCIGIDKGMYALRMYPVCMYVQVHTCTALLPLVDFVSRIESSQQDRHSPQSCEEKKFRRPFNAKGLNELDS